MRGKREERPEAPDEMSTARVYRGGRRRTQRREKDPLVTVSPQVRQSQPAALDQLADAVHTSRAALVCQAIDRLAATPEMPAHAPETPVIVAHGRRIIDTDMLVPHGCGEPGSSALCSITGRRLAAAFSPRAR
jgi:hypothetical protein